MRTIGKTALFASAAAIAFFTGLFGPVAEGNAQGNSGNSAGFAGDNGIGGGHGVAAGAQSGDRGVSGQAMGRGHGGFGDEGDNGVAANERGTTASSLGRLNASNASPTARSNASINSVVGQLGAYETEIADGDFEAAGELLATAANRPITADVVAEVNARLGLELSDEELDAIVDAAVTAQTNATAE